MPDARDQPLLDALLDSWDRNNTILVNLLRALPAGVLELHPAEGSRPLIELFLHAHYTRLFFVSEDAPEHARPPAPADWRSERDVGRIAQMLNESGQAVRDAVRGRVETGRPMEVRYDHPLLMIQHLVWHDGYHHGQIKLALKQAGRALDDEEIGRATWDVWMDKTR